MSDSPAVHVPLDPEEVPILEKVLLLRDRLSLLKQDRSTYIKSKDVLQYYADLVEQVQKLNVIRKEHGIRLEQNRVDKVLDDCFQLISLFFMTIGRNNEAPAQYALTSTMKRLLDHLGEAGFYSSKDLYGIDRQIEKMRENLQRSKDQHSIHLITLLGNRLDACYKTLQELKEKISDLSPEMSPIYEKLVSILRSMAAANTRSKFPRGEIKEFQTELLEMQSQLVDGKFLSVDGNAPSGQEVTVGLLNRCLKWAEIVLERNGKIDPSFQTEYDKLVEIRNQLDKLALTQAWSLRETDLYSYQRQLDRFDEARVEGNFVNGAGQPADLHAQRVRDAKSQLHLHNH
jgi:hypothetical protein